MDTLQRIDPQLVSPHGADDILSPTFMTSFWVLVCFGVIGLPHTAVRCISYKDSKAVHRGIVIGTIVVAILMFGMHLAGALGRAVLPGLTVPRSGDPHVMVQVLPPWAAGLFLAAPMAAIMSNVNAHLLQASATIIKDLWLSAQPTKKRNEQKLKRISTIATLVLGILMMLAAWRPPEMIIWLNLLPSAAWKRCFYGRWCWAFTGSEQTLPGRSARCWWAACCMPCSRRFIFSSWASILSCPRYC